MKKLTQKTFLLLLSISLIIGALTYICVWIFLPYADKNRARHQLEQRTDELVSMLWSTDKAESEPLFLDFVRETGAEFVLLNKEGRGLNPFTFEEADLQIYEGTDMPALTNVSDYEETDTLSFHETRYPFHFADSDEEFVLVVYPNQTRTNEITGAILSSIPYVLVIIVLLSFFGAWYFSHYATVPILRINKIANRLANLDFSWYCPDVRDDEIGMLSKSINELSDKLHEALDELYRKNELLEDEITLEKERERKRMLFFSSVSHELKTPIAVVIGQLEGMQAGIGVYKDREKYLARSAQILQSLNAFIKEVLLVSHIDMIEEKESEEVNLSELTGNILEDYEEYAESYSISLEGEIDDNVIVWGDNMLLGKALGNIIGNAVIHSPENGKVKVRLAHGQQGIEFTVVNTPAHIAEKHLPHVFEAFYRADDDRTNHGSGLGLYITKIILEMYHISHHIENIDVDGGVRFTALFPNSI